MLPISRSGEPLTGFPKKLNPPLPVQTCASVIPQTDSVAELNLSHDTPNCCGTEKVANSRIQQASDTPPSPPVLTRATCHQLWDKDNPDQQGIVWQSDRYKDLLRHGLRALRTLDVKAMLPSLLHYDVIDDAQQRLIMQNTTSSDMIACVVHCIDHGPSWKLHGFVKALAEIGQTSVITTLGLNPDDYDSTYIKKMAHRGVSSNCTGPPGISKGTALSQNYKHSPNQLGQPEILSINEGMEYLHKYSKMRYNLDGHPMIELMEKYKTKLKWLLENRLRIHIFSALIATAMIDQKDMSSLTLVKLLKTLERHVLMRDGEQTTRGKYTDEFYNTCIRCLLTGDRKIENMDGRSPYMAFMSTYKELDSDLAKHTYFTFQDEMFLQYFASQRLIQYLKSDSIEGLAIMLLLCINPDMRNVLRLLCSQIAESEPSLLHHVIFIVRACLILQVKTQHRVKDKLSEELLTLPDLIKRTFGIGAISMGLNGEEAAILRGVCRDIRKVFHEDACILKKDGWFFHGFNNFAESHLHQFIADCLKACTPRQRREIYAQTTDRMLPCAQYNLRRSDGIHYDLFVLLVNDGRWAIIWERRVPELQTDIFAWCPLDVASALIESKKLTQPIPELSGRLNIHFTECSDVWGCPPANEWSETEWRLVLLQSLVLDRVKCINVFADYQNECVPLDGLLAAVQDVVGVQRPRKLLENMCAKTLHQYHIAVWYGEVSEPNLQTFIDWTREVNLIVGLFFNKVMLSRDDDPLDTALLDSIISMDISFRGELYHPTYVTASGKTLSI